MRIPRYREVKAMLEPRLIELMVKAVKDGVLEGTGYTTVGEDFSFTFDADSGDFQFFEYGKLVFSAHINQIGSFYRLAYARSVDLRDMVESLEDVLGLPSEPMYYGDMPKR